MSRPGDSHGRLPRILRAAPLASLLVAYPAALLPIVLGVADPPSAQAHAGALFLRGDITVSTTWQGIVRLTGTVVIREGVTVTVEPGTEVLVQPLPDADIVVKGRLLVRGRPDRPVLFDTAGGCDAGRWGGIVFGKGSSGILEHARVHCAGKGLGGDLTNVRRTGVTVSAVSDGSSPDQGVRRPSAGGR